MAGEFIPISMFIGLTIIISLFFWFRYRSRSDLQATVRAAIQQGQELSPEIVERLGQPRRHKDQDLRLALIWLAVAVGLTLCGYFVPDPSDEAFRAMVAAAAFPLSIGVAYLIMWRFTSREQ